MMNRKVKIVLTAILLLATAVFTVACGEADNQYDINDSNGYTVSIRYDANGGIFNTNCSVIVDSYNIEKMTADSDGKVNIHLLAPEDERRVNVTDSTIDVVENSGCFLAGWYKTRTEQTDENGNTYFAYTDKWDFEEALRIDKNGNYSSSEPVMTLYAVWVPKFKVEFYSLDDPETLIKELDYAPTGDGLTIPSWDTEKGTIKMYEFPTKEGCTFNGVYYDAEGTKKAEGEKVKHTGTIDEQTGVAENTVMKLYIDWIDGTWYHIYNAEQLSDNVNVNGHYVLHNDLDFENEIWPSAFTTTSFKGSIDGNGYTIRNVTVAQSDGKKVNYGLFGRLDESAKLANVSFENVSVTVSGIQTPGSSYGLFAGAISEGAILENVKLRNSILYIDTDGYYATEDYSLGTVCGTGTADITTEGIGYDKTGESTDSVTLTESNGLITIVKGEEGGSPDVGESSEDTEGATEITDEASTEESSEDSAE